MEQTIIYVPYTIKNSKEQWRLSAWYAKPGSPVRTNQRLATIRNESGATHHVVAPHNGTLKSHLLEEGEKIDVTTSSITTIEYCPHSVVFKGVCALCGEAIDNPHFAETNQSNEMMSVAYNPSTLSITRQEAENASAKRTWRLFEERKLSLVLDLDHTLVHATEDNQAVHVPQISPEGADVSSIRTLTLSGPNGVMQQSLMFVKFRPHLQEFLKRLSMKFELHIYTMGSRPYADAVARLIDPDGKFFDGRITSRDDFEEGRFNRKSIQRLFPCDDSMVLIFDDREDVWINGTDQLYMPNLISAHPYTFWGGLTETYDRTSASNSVQNHSTPPPQVNKECEDPNSNHTSDSDPTAVSVSATAKLAPSCDTNGNSASEGQVKEETSKANGVCHSKNVSNAALNVEKENAESTQEKEESRAETAIEPGECSTSAETSKANGVFHSKNDSNAALNVEKENAESAQKKEESRAETAIELGECSTSAELQSDCKENNGDNLQQSNNHVHNASSTTVDLKKQSHGTQVPVSTNSFPNNDNQHDEAQSVYNASNQQFSDNFRKTVKSWWDSDNSTKWNGHLLRVAEVLEDCHKEFFKQADKHSKRSLHLTNKQHTLTHNPKRIPVDVKDILAEKRGKVLEGCVITFTGVIPSAEDPSTFPVWNLALRLGAVCSMEFVNGRTTHVVASLTRPTNTQKCRDALLYGTAYVVSLNWLEDSALNFRRQDEYKYSTRAEARFEGQPEYRAFVEARHKEAQSALRKRGRPELEDISANEEMLPHKFRKLDDHGSRSAVTNYESNSSQNGSNVHVLTGDEIGEALEALMDD